MTDMNEDLDKAIEELTIIRDKLTKLVNEKMEVSNDDQR